jgi:hypothetical protein
MRADYKVHCTLALGSDVRYVVAVLIYSASVLLNPLRFIWCFRLVIFGEKQYLFTAINTHDGAGIANIGKVAHVAND